MNTKHPPCIVCGQSKVEQFLDLGTTPLANKFLARKHLAAKEPAFPLCVGFCHTCSHVQLTQAVPPGAMFEDYLYISSASSTLKAHLFDLSDIVTQRYNLGKNNLVVDIGCNDGTLLSGFKRHGVRTLGVDPAKNLAAFTDKLGIDRHIGFFNSTSAKEILAKYGPASAITATNTFPHIPALQDFVRGIQTLLAPDGVFVIEAHYLIDILDQGAFDTVYHEHISYWALGPICRLFEAHGMEVVNAERLNLHHGQLRVFVQRKGAGKVQPAVREILEMERARGLDRFETFTAFAADVQRIKHDLTKTINDLRAQGKRIAAYGAPAKGNTLLCFLELGTDKIEYIVDRSPLKQGLFTPGLHVPVVPPERLLTDKPDYLLLLAWNFLDEILEQQKAYRTAGGKFIIPIPTVKIV